MFASFEDILESLLDTDMSCKECRYYDSDKGKCGGVGSVYYMKEVPYPEFIPKPHECKVRLPPSLLTFF